MEVEVVEEMLDFRFGVGGWFGLGGTDFVEGWFDARVDLRVEVEGPGDGLDTFCGFLV